MQAVRTSAQSDLKASPMGSSQVTVYGLENAKARIALRVTV